MENREIKFRAWSEGKMYTQSDKDEFTIYNIEKLFGKIKGDAILMQYTGLKDKNGVEIYEGDIVKGGGINDIIKKKFKISTIVYRGKGFCVKDEDFGYEGEGLWYWEKIEVIGNVYQNPELLK